MDNLPYDDEALPGGCTARDVDKSQGVDDAPGWDPYDVPDEDWADEKYDDWGRD